MQENIRKSDRGGIVGMIRSSLVFSALVILFTLPILAIAAFLTMKLPILEDYAEIISAAAIILTSFSVGSSFAKKMPSGAFLSNLVRSLFLSFVIFTVSVAVGPETRTLAHSITVLCLIPASALTGTVLSQVRSGSSKKTKLDKRFKKSLKK